MKWFFSKNNGKIIIGYAENNMVDDLAKEKGYVNFLSYVGDTLLSAITSYNKYAQVPAPTNKRYWTHQIAAEEVEIFGDLYLYTLFLAKEHYFVKTKTAIEAIEICDKKHKSGSLFYGLSINEAMEDAINNGWFLPSDIESTAKYIGFEELITNKQCDCGAEKCGTTHSNWCSTND